MLKWALAGHINDHGITVEAGRAIRAVASGALAQRSDGGEEHPMAGIRWPKPTAYIVQRAMAEDRLSWSHEPKALNNVSLYTRKQMEKMLVAAGVAPSDFHCAREGMCDAMPPRTSALHAAGAAGLLGDEDVLGTSDDQPKEN